MITVICRTQDKAISGFRISGHAGMGVSGQDIVCAAVSSAAYMTANTLTEILHLDPAITVEDGLMDVAFDEAIPEAQAILSGFRLHIQALQEQYPDRVHLMNTEV